MIKFDKVKVKRFWKWLTYTPIGLVVSFGGLFVENIFFARISPPIFEFIAQNCGDLSRNILRLPKPVECKYTPKNKPTNGEPFLYDVDVTIDFQHRESSSGMIILRSSPHFFIHRDSVETIEGVSLEKIILDDAQKRITGFEVKYQDGNISSLAKMKFVSQFTERRRAERCGDFLLLEH